MKTRKQEQSKAILIDPQRLDDRANRLLSLLLTTAKEVKYKGTYRIKDVIEGKIDLVLMYPLLARSSERNPHNIKYEVIGDELVRANDKIIWSVLGTLSFAKNHIIFHAKPRIIKEHNKILDLMLLKSKMGALEGNDEAITNIIQIIKNEYKDFKESVFQEYYFQRATYHLNPKPPIVGDEYDEEARIIKLVGYQVMNRLGYADFGELLHKHRIVLPLYDRLQFCINSARMLRKQVHLRGITHRDVKSWNMMLEDNNGIHYVDYGNSKYAYQAIDKEDQNKCTKEFDSPYPYHEECFGFSSNHLDIYSLGIIHNFIWLGKCFDLTHYKQHTKLRGSREPSISDYFKQFKILNELTVEQLDCIKRLLLGMQSSIPSSQTSLSEIIVVYENIFLDIRKKYLTESLQKSFQRAYQEALTLRNAFEVYEKNRIGFMPDKIISQLKQKYLLAVDCLVDVPEIVQQFTFTLAVANLAECTTAAELKKKGESIFTEYESCVKCLRNLQGSNYQARFFSQLSQNETNKNFEFVLSIRRALARRNKYTFDLDLMIELNRKLKKDIQKIEEAFPFCCKKTQEKQELIIKEISCPFI